jgi:hypothetical protein
MNLYRLARLRNPGILSSSPFQLKYASLPPFTRSFRRFSQGTSPPSSPQSRSWVSPFFTVLLFAGLGATAYGVYVIYLYFYSSYASARSYRYEIYDFLTLWPTEVRSDLRSGLRAKHRGDLDASEQYLRRFVCHVIVLPSTLPCPDPR